MNSAQAPKNALFPTLCRPNFVKSLLGMEIARLYREYPAVTFPEFHYLIAGTA